jgi:NADH dehydrogenase (ubiquinone) Fe-S protein 1
MVDAVTAEMLGGDIIRILPRFNAQHEQWITDRTRFFSDGLNKQRLTKPIYRKSLDKPFTSITYTSATNILAEHAESMHILMGSYLDSEQLTLLKQLWSTQITSQLTTDFELLTPDLFHQPSITQISNLIGLNTAFLIFDVELKTASPILHTKIRLEYEKGSIGVYSLGQMYAGIGQNLASESKCLPMGKHIIFSLLHRYDHICFISDNTTSSYLATVLEKIARTQTFQTIWAFSIRKPLTNTFGTFLNYTATRPFTTKPKDIIILQESDDLVNINQLNFVIYIGHHGDLGASNANLVIPSSTIYERKTAYTYTFDGDLRKFGDIQPSLIPENKPSLNASPKYQNLFPNKPLPVRKDEITFVPDRIKQQFYSQLDGDVITRASPTLALASKRLAQVSIARDNF